MNESIEENNEKGDDVSDVQQDGGGGGVAAPLPRKVFMFFFLDDKTSANRAHFETSLVMISYYGYEMMMQSNYLCVILHVKRKQLSILTAFISFLPPPPPPPSLYYGGGMTVCVRPTVKTKQ